MNNNKGTFSLSFEWHSIFKDLIVNCWTIVLCAIIGFLGVYVAQQTFYTPVFTSQAILSVSTRAGNSSVFTNLSQSQEMAEVITKVLVQPTLTEKACEKAGRKLEGEVEASVIKGTNFIRVSVTADDPESAFYLLKNIIEVYPDISDQMFANAALKVLNRPTFPNSSSRRISNSWRYKAAFIMAFLAFAAIVVLSMLRDTVKDKKCFLKKVDSELLGTIPHENKFAGFKDFFKKSKRGLLIDDRLTISLVFSECYQQVANRLRHMRSQNGDKVFVISSLSENEGKSTVVSNLAVSLAHNGYRVLLLDLDLKKPALHKMFNKRSDDNVEIAKLISGEIPKEEYHLRHYKKTHISLALNTHAHPDYQKYLESNNIKEILDYYREKFDFILIDTAPLVFDAAVTSILPIVDGTILVVRTDSNECAAVNEGIRTIKNTGGKLAGCILNDVYKEFSLFGQFGQDERGYYGTGYYHSYGYGKYGKYGHYGKYGNYGHYGRYGHYGNYSKSAGVEEKDAELPQVSEADIEVLNLNEEE